jgi:hypothetical protein
MLKKTAIIVVAALSLVFSRPLCTYYLLPSPGSFTIYNEYEQSLSPEELARFAPYTPLRLVAGNVLLGDGISHAAKFRYGAAFFYLLRDASGRLAGESPKTEPVVLVGGESLDDTVEATRGGVLAVASLSGKVATIAQGKLLARFFRYGGRCYVSTLDGPPGFGWCSLDGFDAWRRFGAAPAAVAPASVVSAAMPESLREKIRAKIEAANDEYRRFFSRFDGSTGAEKAVPHWSCECTGAQCRCILSPPYDKSDELSESARELRTEIGNLLSGSGFMLTGGRGEMVILREGQRK